MTTIREAVRKLYPRVRGREEPIVPLRPLHIMQSHADWIWSLASIPDSNLFVSGSGDHSCRVWSAKNGSEVGKAMVHGDRVYAIVVSKDGKTVASGGNDGKINVWTLESREKIIGWDTSESWVFSLAMSQDSKTVASGHGNGTIRLWNASTGDRIAGPYQLHDARVLAVSFSTDDSQIASGGSDGHIHVTHSHSGEDAIPPFRAHDDWIQSLVWPPNGQLISASLDKTVKCWDSSNGSLLAINNRHMGSLSALAVSSDGKLLASVSGDGAARLWNASTHEQIGSTLQHRTPLFAAALCSDGHYLATAGKDRKVYIWNLKDIHEVAKVIAEDSITAAPEVQSQPSSGGAITGHDTNLDNNDVAKGPQTDSSDGTEERPDLDAEDVHDVPSWLDQPAIPLIDNDTAAFYQARIMAEAREGTSPGALGSVQRHQLFDGLHMKILNPFRIVGKSLRPSRERMEGSVPVQSARIRLIAALKKPASVLKQPTQVQMQRPAGESILSTPSIQNSPARPGDQRSHSSLWRHSRTSSRALPIDPITAARAKEVIVVGRWPAQRKLPRWLKPNDPNNKPWHRYLLRKQQEYLAGSDESDSDDDHQTGVATSTGSSGCDKPLPPLPSSPSAENVGTSSTSQPGAQPMVQLWPERTRPPSEISFTSCEMFCMWFWRSEPSWRDEYLPRG